MWGRHDLGQHISTLSPAALAGWRRARSKLRMENMYLFHKAGYYVLCIHRGDTGRAHVVT